MSLTMALVEANASGDQGMIEQARQWVTVSVRIRKAINHARTPARRCGQVRSFRGRLSTIAPGG